MTRFEIDDIFNDSLLMNRLLIQEKFNNIIFIVLLINYYTR